MKQLIYLIGYRATGKSSTARALAELLGWPSLDTDAMIAETAGQTIADIFRKSGEDEFRRLETEAIATCANSPPAVIATGGGAILAETNRHRMNETGIVFWLTASVDTIRRRLLSDNATNQNRPALHGGDVSTEVADVLSQREILYETSADAQVATDDRSPKEVAQIIFDQLSLDPSGVTLG